MIFEPSIRQRAILYYFRFFSLYYILFFTFSRFLSVLDESGSCRGSRERRKWVSWQLVFFLCIDIFFHFDVASRTRDDRRTVACFHDQ